MLKVARSLRELNFSQLMEVYAESNRENGEEFYPQLSGGERLLQAEQDFYEYLRNSFFRTEGAYYALWVEKETCVSALRIEPYKDGVLLEALETAPDHRRKGYAKQLIQAVLNGEKKVYSHVGKRNIASLKVHEACGFQRISEQAVYIDCSVNAKCCTLCFAVDKAAENMV